MKIIIVLLFNLFLSIFGLETTTNFCVNCKHFKPTFGSDIKYGECHLFLKKNDANPYLDTDVNVVTGIKEKRNKEYFYSSVARSLEHMCGKEGKFYEEKDRLTITDFVKTIIKNYKNSL